MHSLCVHKKKCTTQGCVLSLILFNVYSENILKNAMDADDDDDDAIIGDNRISNIQYRISDSLNSMQNMINRVCEVGVLNNNEVDIYACKKKSYNNAVLQVEFTFVSKNCSESINTYIWAPRVQEEVDQIEKKRIEKARATFGTMKKLS